MKFFIFLMVLLSTALSAQQMYKWTDSSGKIVYSDQPPPKDARNVQEKRSNASVIENNQTSIATAEAQKRFPVTFYSTKCGEFCDKAQAYLNKRGVPHTVTDPSQPAEFEKYKTLTGGTRVPALKVGDAVQVGFDESAWAAALDKAGYSKTAALQANKQSPAAQAANAANAKNQSAGVVTDANHPMVSQLSALLREHVTAAKKGEVNPYLNTLDADSKAKTQGLDAEALKKLGAQMCDPALAQFVQMEFKFNAARLVYTQRVGPNQIACATKLIDENNKWKVALREIESQEADKDPAALLSKVVNSTKSAL